MGPELNPTEKAEVGWAHWVSGRPPWLADQPVGPIDLKLGRGSSSLDVEVDSWRINCRRSFPRPWRLRIYSWFMKYLPPHLRLRASSLFPSGDVGWRQQALYLSYFVLSMIDEQVENKCGGEIP